MKRRHELIVQTHHLQYEPKPETVIVYKGEHLILTLLRRRKNWSQGMITALQFEIDRNRAGAKAL